MFIDFLQHLVKNKHCISCRWYKCNYSRYNTFDFGTCEKTFTYAPLTNHCQGKYYEQDKTVEHLVKELESKKNRLN